MMLKLFLEINSSAVDNHVNHSSEDEVQQYEKQGDVGNIFMILFNLVHKVQIDYVLQIPGYIMRNSTNDFQCCGRLRRAKIFD